MNATRRIGAALAAALLFTLPARAQLRSQWPLVTIPPAPDAGPAGAATASPSGLQPAPRSLLPTRIQVLRDPLGTGIVVYGTLTGKADSALAVLAGIFAYSQAFDPTPKLQLAVADRDDRRVEVLFTGAVEGSPIIGIAVIALSDSSGDVSLFYDNAATFPASFARLQRAYAESNGTGTVALTPLRLADGSEIAIPQGWRVTGQGSGSVDLLGPLGAVVSLGAVMPVSRPGSAAGGYASPAQCCDPVKALQAIYPQIAATDQRLGVPARQLTAIVETQPAEAPTGGEAAFVLADLNVGGRPYSYFALVTAAAGFAEPWTVTLSGVMAPQADFAGDFPTYLRIWNSYSANPQGFAGRLRQAAQGMTATSQLLEATINTRETADYNADEGWNQLLQTAAGAGMPSGGEARLDEALAQPLADKLSQKTGRSWRVVPRSELE